MYKSRLQELCQKELYVIPKYTTTRQGPDHNPSFYATVVLGENFSFSSPQPCRSSKEAQNEAARLAFDHFFKGGSSSRSSPTKASTPKKDGAPSYDESSSGVSPQELSGLECLFKSQLQHYAQRRTIGLPSYDSVREGPDHAVRHKAKVTVDGQTFESPQFFNSLREAENAAAKIALASLSKDGNTLEEPAVFKNILQEFAQKECLEFPVYKTVEDGPSHMPNFISTVEVGGENFVGDCAGVKKQAEQNAAKVAWHALKARKSSQVGHAPHFTREVHEDPHIVKSMPRTNLVSERCNNSGKESHQNEIRKTNLPSDTNSAKRHYAERRDNVFFGKHLDKGKLDFDCSSDSAHRETEHDNSKKSKTSTKPSDITYSQLRDPILLEGSSSQDGISLPSSQSDLSSDHKVANKCAELPPMEIYSLPSQNRVVVYPRKPNMVLPEGASLLPFSDNKWVAADVNPSSKQ